MKLKCAIAGVFILIMGLVPAFASDSTPIGLATFTTANVNLRMEPSTQSPYLCYQQGEELYFEPENICWSHQLGSMNIGGKVVYTDHKRMYGEMGPPYAVVGTEGDWVKLKYLGFDVWTMKKFLKISPFVTPSTSTTAGGDYNLFCLTGDADGSLAVFYQEGGMDDDFGLLLGAKKGNTVVFDHFLPSYLRYDEKIQGVEVSRDPDYGTIIFSYGPSAKLASFTDYEVIDMKGFDPESIQKLISLSNPIAPQIFMTSGSDYIFFPEQ